jgi:selenide,water dikinase
VFRLDDGSALIQTVDFFTPIVDDPEIWGRIAAANALSDIYAMGGDPLTALQLVGWPRDDLPMELLASVIEGGASVMAEAGCTIVGGHSIDDAEPKYGFAVTGIAPVTDVTTNATAKPGQGLWITKPLGTGIVATAIKHGAASRSTAADAIDVMATLNRGAADAVRRVGGGAVTDVTGFGLLGHLSEMVRASRVSASVRVASVPVLDGVRDLVERSMIPGGTKRNLAAVHSMVDPGDTSESDRMILADAQTSGGLLVAIDTALGEAFEQALADVGSRGWRIGSIVERQFEHGPSGQIALT